MSRSRAKHRVLTGIYSWVFICWLVWLVFVSTKISPVSSPRTRIHVLVSQAALATASKGPEEKSSFQSHRPQIMASGDRSITHTADSWTWGDCMPLSFSESIKAHRMPLSSQLKLVYLGNSAVNLSRSPKSRWTDWFHLAHMGHQHRQATLLWLACVCVHACPSGCCWLTSPIALHLLLRQSLLESETC